MGGTGRWVLILMVVFVFVAGWMISNVKDTWSASYAQRGDVLEEQLAEEGSSRDVQGYYYLDANGDTVRTEKPAARDEPTYAGF